jgi:hypothetical protein
MTCFIMSEPELRRLNGRYSYSSNGFILLEWQNGQHHFRFDLERWEGRGGSGGRFQQIDERGRDYEFRITSIHLKYDIHGETGGAMDYYYFYVVYMGGGVWQPVWDYEAQQLRTGNRRFEATPESLSRGYRLTSDLLDEIGGVTRTSQAIAAGPTLGPQTVPGFVRGG